MIEAFDDCRSHGLDDRHTIAHIRCEDGHRLGVDGVIEMISQRGKQDMRQEMQPRNRCRTWHYLTRLWKRGLKPLFRNTIFPHPHPSGKLIVNILTTFFLPFPGGRLLRNPSTTSSLHEAILPSRIYQSGLNVSRTTELLDALLHVRALPLSVRVQESSPRSPQAA